MLFLKQQVDFPNKREINTSGEKKKMVPSTGVNQDSNCSLLRTPVSEVTTSQEKFCFYI